MRYYVEFFSLLLPFTFLSLLSKSLLLNYAKKQLRNKSVFFNVLLVGSENKTKQLFESFKGAKDNSGYVVTSFLNVNGPCTDGDLSQLHHYTGLENLDEAIEKNTIEEVVIAVEKNERLLIGQILNQLSDKEVNVKISPDMIDILTGALQTTNVLGVPLIDIHSGQLPGWQQNIKRFADITIATLGLILISPVLLYAMIRTKFSSAGPIFYKQERLGFKG